MSNLEIEPIWLLSFRKAWNDEDRIGYVGARVRKGLSAVFDQVPAVRDVLIERSRQDEKWGEQNWPDGTGPETRPLQPQLRVNAVPPHAHARDLAIAFTQETDQNAMDGLVTFADILLEEVFEALAEDDPQRLRTELVQVAAVAAQWIEAIDRRATA